MAKDIKIPVSRRTSLEMLAAAIGKKITVTYDAGQMPYDQTGILREISSDGLLISKESDLFKQEITSLFMFNRIICITLPPAATPGGVLIEGAKLSGLNETEAEK